MKQRLLSYFIIIALAAGIGFIIHSQCSLLNQGVELTAQPAAKAKSKVVLIPLDSRPPCTQFVRQLGSLANIEVLLPPVSMMDNYKTPADRQALRKWLLTAAADADAAVISIDMLIHGGLLASRVVNGGEMDALATLALINQLHQQHPRLKIYAYNIIPRLLLADNSDYRNYQFDILNFSVLQDQVYTFENPRDIAELEQLQRLIPAKVIDNYRSLYEKNTNISLALIELVEKGVITSLVLGQDDSQPFGLPNITAQRLTSQIRKNPSLSRQVYITRGTDEVALTLLGQFATQQDATRPQVFVRYSHPAAPSVVMPYMPHSVAKTVQEKVDLLGGSIVNSPDEADFVLYVHIGTPTTPRRVLAEAAQAIDNLIKQGHHVALVDLSETFKAEHTLLPVLIEKEINILQLVGYAGWNTTSNSVGTAVTQAALFTGHLKLASSFNDVLTLYHNNLNFLTARFLDDWYYQKDVKLQVDDAVARVNADRYSLSNNYEATNLLVRRLMNNRAHQLYRRTLSRIPVNVSYADQTAYLVVNSLYINCHLPWHRTFEIYVEPRIGLTLVDLD